MTQLPNQQTVLPSKLISGAVSQNPADGVDRGGEIQRDNFEVANQTVEELRRQGNLAEALRQLSYFEGTSSSAIFSFVEVAHSSFKVTAYDTVDNTVSPEGMSVARSVLAGMNTLYDYTEGFGDKATVGSVIESGLLDVLTTGAICGELVLDDQRLPSKIALVPYDSLKYESRGDGTKYPVQEAESGDDINLDLPTFFISESHKHSGKAYARPMLEPSLNDAFHYKEFVNDMRRSVRRAGSSRLKAKLAAEEVRAAAPPEVQQNPKKMLKWLEDNRTLVEDQLSSINPEDALVFYDSLEIELMKAEGEKADYVPLLNAISGNLATSLKSSPSVLGLRINGSQSLSNTESLVFLKIARSIQKPVEDFMSRLLTLACRLYGADVYIHFRFDAINLRPEDELAAFKTMHTDHILKLLSYGFVTDDQAAVMLGTGERSPDAPELSGTMFMDGNNGMDASKASPNADPQGRALQPDTPSKAGGKSQ